MDQKAVQIATPKNMPVVMNETEDDVNSWSAINFEPQGTSSPR